MASIGIIDSCIAFRELAQRIHCHLNCNDKSQQNTKKSHKTLLILLLEKIEKKARILKLLAFYLIFSYWIYSLGTGICGPARYFTSDAFTKSPPPFIT